MENNDKLIESLRNCARSDWTLCGNCVVALAGDCEEMLMLKAVDALTRKDIEIAGLKLRQSSDARIIQSLRQSCDAFSRRNMEMVEENWKLRSKERHGRWIFKPMYDYGEFACCCSECGEPTRDNSPEWCPHCGAQMDEEGKI